MLAQWSTLLTLDADGRAAIGLEKFIFSGMRRDIAQIYFEQMNHNDSPPPTDCDRFASNGYDPFRLSAPIEFDTIELPGALNACEEAVSQHPGDPHFRYLRGRAAHRAGVIAASAGDNDLASKRFAEARSDYEAAMAKGYPAAFNNMGQMIYYGQGSRLIGRKPRRTLSRHSIGSSIVAPSRWRWPCLTRGLRRAPMTEYKFPARCFYGRQRWETVTPGRPWMSCIRPERSRQRPRFRRLTFRTFRHGSKNSTAEAELCSSSSCSDD